MRPERLIALIFVLGATAAIAVAYWLATAPPPAASPDAPPSSGELGVVVHVSDGDTIVVEVSGRRERVRYIGVDAPEVARPADGTPAECGGDAARAANETLVEGHEVRLERDRSDRDRFGRLLRHVWVPTGSAWRLVSETLVEGGAVEARSYPPDIARDDQLDAAEHRARQAGVGIWATC